MCVIQSINTSERYCKFSQHLELLRQGTGADVIVKLHHALKGVVASPEVLEALEDVPRHMRHGPLGEILLQIFYFDQSFQNLTAKIDRKSLS